MRRMACWAQRKSGRLTSPPAASARVTALRGLRTAHRSRALLNKHGEAPSDVSHAADRGRPQRPGRQNSWARGASAWKPAPVISATTSASGSGGVGHHDRESRPGQGDRARPPDGLLPPPVIAATPGRSMGLPSLVAALLRCRSGLAWHDIVRACWSDTMNPTMTDLEPRHRWEATRTDSAD